MKLKKCSGCIYCRERKLPDFSKMTEDEEFEFWSSHSPLQFDEWIEENKPLEVSISRPVKKIRTTLFLDPNLKNRIELLARRKGIRYQTFIQMVLKEQTDKELKRIKTVVRH